VIVDVSEPSIPPALVARESSWKRIRRVNLGHPVDPVHQNRGTKLPQNQNQRGSRHGQSKMLRRIYNVILLPGAIDRVTNLGQTRAVDFIRRAGKTVGAANFLNVACGYGERSDSKPRTE
jgi:hypothetical protein